MKKLLIISAMLLMANTAKAQQYDFGLPELYKIKTATLSPSYSCRAQQNFQGFGDTALFLSAYSKQRNSPDLLFNGACGSENHFMSSTAGDDMALIADLGDIALENMTAHLAFNTKGISSFANESKFVRTASVKEGHTYAVLLNKGEIRGLFIFRVIGYVPDQKVDIRYAVKEYQVLAARAQSLGFEWERKSQQ